MTDDAPNEFPLSLSDDAVRAVLDGSKSQHRLPVLPANSTVLGHPAKWYWPHLMFDHAVPHAKTSLLVALLGADKAPDNPNLSVPFRHPDDPPEDDVRDYPWFRVRPKWVAGDRFWVKEAWTLAIRADTSIHSERVPHYRADGVTLPRWRSATTMPRAASRITLEVVGVRGERSEAAGGCGWDWVTEFRRVTS